jgi:hypothetical protein
MKHRVAGLFVSVIASVTFAAEPKRFEGTHFSGAGDTAYLELLETARRMFEPDARWQNMSMLYEPAWNGLVEGPTWDAWWIQNSYGGTYAWLPWATEPWTTFIENSQALWFAAQGDGKRADKNGYVAPDGCLVDAANLKVHYYRQGDGRHDTHDWFMEATAAGALLQCELLLISRDEAKIAKYLPQLERAANFIETRRDPKTGLYQGGIACNLLAPSFAGYLKPDGTRGLAFHAGLQVTYIAMLDRLIELEKLAGHMETAAAYEKRRDLAKESLPKLTTDEGYFINSIDPDGTKHGVFGAAKHGYFESSVNHDAVALRVADDAQAKKIVDKIKSIPQLRPHGLIIPNHPGYDDMYEKPEALWAYGYWVNGGHWSTAEARMILAYYRTGQFDDARRSMEQILKFARQFRMDNPLTDFGNAVYQPTQPINITYDAFAIPAAMVRGLFEYLYKSDRLVLVPHLPAGVVHLEQKDPIRFGTKKVYITTTGSGHVSAVTVNNNVWTEHNEREITLPYEALPDETRVQIRLGVDPVSIPIHSAIPSTEPANRFEAAPPLLRLFHFHVAMEDARLTDTYESRHAVVAANAFGAARNRKKLLEAGQIERLPEPSAAAAEKLYDEAAQKLYRGLDTVLAGYKESPDPQKKRIYEMWNAASGK